MLIKKPERRTRFRQANLAEESMSTQAQNELNFDDSFFQHNLPQYYRAILQGFRKVTHSFISFHLFYSIFFVTELFFFFFFSPFLMRSAVLAFALGGIFLTCFSYFILFFYFQAKKTEQLTSLRNQFLQSCRQTLSVPAGEVQHHLSIADALFKLAAYLQDFESNFYQVPKILSGVVSRCSSYCYGEDVFKMKQLLLQAAVDEHLNQIRLTPTDLEVHASLANTYVALSKIYKGAPLEEKHRKAVRLAIEEFSILGNYAPNDPWIHEQLAIGYRDLEMPEEEMREVETLLKICPQDKEILYRLGRLYFKQGMNAKGLQIYEELKKANFKKAEDLIASYFS